MNYELDFFEICNAVIAENLTVNKICITMHIKFQRNILKL